MNSRHQRRPRLFDFAHAADHLLERRELMAAEILMDVNIAPSATLLFDNGPTQFYLQGKSLVAVEGTQKLVLNTDLDLGLYGFRMTFRQVGDSTLIIGRQAEADSLLAYRYEQGAGQAELISTWDVDRWYRPEPEKLVRSGDELILVVDPEQGQDSSRVFRYDAAAGDFVAVNSPVAGGSIVDVDPLGGGRFLVVASLEGNSTGYAYDPVSTTFEPLTAETTGEQNQATILSNAMENQKLFAFAGGLYVTDGTTVGTRSIALDPEETLGTNFVYVTFGSDHFIGTYTSDFFDLSYSILRIDADFEEVTLVGASQSGQFDGLQELNFQLYASADRLMAFAWDRFDSPIMFVSSYDPIVDQFVEKAELPVALRSIHSKSDGEMVLFTEANGWESFGYGVYETVEGVPVFVDEFDGYLRSVIPYDDKLLLMTDHEHYVTIGSYDTVTREVEELKAIEQRLAHLGYLEPGDSYYVITSEGLVFQAGDAAHGVEPWITNGTMAGTSRLADVVPGPGSSYAQSFRSVDGGVEFVARGPDDVNRTYRHLWSNQETVAGLELLSETAGSSGYVGLGSNKNSQVTLGDLVVFTAFDGNSLSLFATDGTPGGTTVLADRLLSQELTSASGKAFFLRLASNASELWATDGTTLGTMLVKVFEGKVIEFNAASENGDASRTYASFRTKSATTGLQEIWISDGTAGGTRVATTLGPDASLGYPWDLPVNLGNQLVYMVRPTPEEPWALVAVNVDTGVSVTLTTSESEFQSYGKTESGLLYFETYPSDPFEKELYSTDGTIAGTGPVVLPAGLVGSPAFVTRRGLLVAKSGEGSEDAVDLHFDWEGTEQLLPFRVSDYAGAGSISTSAFQRGAFVDGGFVYFFYEKNVEETTSTELWRTDGTAVGTQPVLSPQSGGPQIGFAWLIEAGDATILEVNDQTQSQRHHYLMSGEELPILLDLNAGYSDALDIIGVVGDRLLVHQDNGTHGQEPYFFRLGGVDLLEIAPIDPVSIEENLPWTYQVVASGAASSLQYSLLPGAPDGMTIDADTGLISWAPGEHQGGMVYPVTVRVESFEPQQSAEASFVVTVGEDNKAPVLGDIQNFVISEHQDWSFQVNATDADLPAQSLAYAFDGAAPAGMTIDAATGMIRWKPSESQGGLTTTVRVTVTDSGAMPLSDTKAFTISVMETNEPPVIAPIADMAIFEGELLSFVVGATESDLPAQALIYRLTDSVAAGASIDSATGLFQWRPTMNTASHRFTVEVSDSGSPAKVAQVSFQVNVKPVTMQISRYVPTFNRQRAITALTIELSQQVDIRSARRLTNFRIVNAGRDGRFGTRDDRAVRIRAVRVSADRKSIVVTPQGGLARNRSYRMTVLDNVLDSFGRRLDGDKDGAFGGSSSLEIIRGIIS